MIYHVLSAANDSKTSQLKRVETQFSKFKFAKRLERKTNLNYVTSKSRNWARAL